MKLRHTLKSSAILVILILFSGFSSLAQNVTITGTITDQNDGSGLIGVNVVVKDAASPIGTTSDVEGKYALNVPKGSTLLFSYIGYIEQEVVVADSKTIDVAMATEDELLEEVVVIGYGSVKKEDLTGVVTKVGEDEFNRGVISSPEKLLTGKVAGLQINSSGEPGGGSRLRIRGGASLDGGGGTSNNPLIVVDGVPLDDRGSASGRNPLNFINAADVADMTILKDASAAAIYGSRGANGVIIITTKSGGKKLRVNYDGYYSISDFVNSVPILSSSDFRKAINAKAPQKIASLGEENTDWVDEVTQAASGMQHNLSFGGGYKKSNYFISFNHMYNNGVIRTTKNSNTNVAVNLSTKLLNDNLIIKIHSKSGWNKDDFAPNVIGAAQAFDPTQPVLDAESEFGGYFQWPNELATKNPVASLMQSTEEGKGTRLLNSVDLEYQLPFLEGLSLKVNASYDYLDGEKYQVKDPLLRENFINGGFLKTETERHTSKLLETYATYKKELGASKFDFTAGYSWQGFTRENKWVDGLGLVMADNDYSYIATEEIKPDSFITENRLISFFGRLNYNFDEKYLLTLSLRRDGSSRFGPANQWGYFPAAALAWRVLQEDFAEGLKGTFTDLKLRMSYGITGNESIGDYQYAIFYGYGTDDARYQFGDEFVNTLRGGGVDPNIKWESTSSLNLGIDFGVFNNRLTGTIDLYKKTTSDLLFGVATAAFTNLSDRVVTNIAELENKGIELALQSYVVDRSDFDWNIGFTANYNKNEITKLDNSNLPEFGGYQYGDISGDIGQQILLWKVGESVGAFRVYDQIYDSNGAPVVSDDATEMYVDQNDDGMINDQDYIIYENSAPDFMFGLTNNISYKNVDLGFTIRANTGNYVYNNTASNSGYFERLSESEVTNNVHSSAFTTNFVTRQLKSNYYVEDASFIKLDNITIGYTIKSLKFIESIRLYATAQNVLTITGYSGIDPESPQFTDGIDNGIYPNALTYLFGASASF